MATTMRTETLRLYKKILKLSIRFPSIKRDQLVHNIRVEFRENRSLTRRDLIEEKISIAEQGVKQLEMYCNLNDANPNWSVDMVKEVFRPVNSNNDN